MRKVLLWSRHHFHADSNQVLHERAIPQLNHFLILLRKWFPVPSSKECFLRRKHNGNFFNFCLVFLCTSRERFCKNERNFANMMRTTKVTRIPQWRALLNNGSVLTFTLTAKNNACAVKQE